MSGKNKKRLNRALDKNDGLEAGFATGMTKTKEVLQDHGVNIYDDKTVINKSKEAYDAIHEMAEIAGEAMKERLHKQSDACLQANETVSGIACGLARWEALIEISNRSDKEFETAVRNFRMSLERELGAIEHCLKTFKRLDVHGLADDLERIEKALANPAVTAIMKGVKNEA